MPNLFTGTPTAMEYIIREVTRNCAEVRFVPTFKDISPVEMVMIVPCNDGKDYAFAMALNASETKDCESSVPSVAYHMREMCQKCGHVPCDIDTIPLRWRPEVEITLKYEDEHEGSEEDVE